MSAEVAEIFSNLSRRGRSLRESLDPLMRYLLANGRLLQPSTYPESATDTGGHRPGRRRGLLPLPVPSASAEEFALEEADRSKVGGWLSFNRELAPAERGTIKRHVRVLIELLNRWYCGCVPEDARQLVPGAVQKVSYWLLFDAVRLLYFERDCKHEGEDWPDFLRKRDINYQGEPVQRATRLTWDQVEPGLPPPERCAKLDVRLLAEGPVLDYLENPLNSLVDLAEVEVRPKPGAVLVREGDLLPLVQGLLVRGLVRPVREAELVRVRGEPVLNGLFGVVKPDTLAADHPRLPGAPVLRLIMNLTATNALTKPFDADIAALPYMGQWRSLMLGENDTITWSYDDLRGCFYLYSFPPSWAPLFCFNTPFAPQVLGLGPEYSAEEVAYIGAVTAPMGYRNMMGIIQYLNRRVHLQRWPGAAAPFDPAREVRKDRSVPPFEASAGDLSKLWQIYCDDSDYMEIHCGDFPGPEAPAPGGAARRAAEPSSLQAAGREHFAHWNMPLSSKCGHHELLSKRLGAEVDGAQGRLGPGAARMGLVLGLSAFLLAKPDIARKELQVLCGLWCHVLSFRREISSACHHVWGMISKWGAARRRRWPANVRAEIIQLIVLAPLCIFNLRAAVSPDLIASDASEKAIGACRSTRLNAEGKRQLVRSIGSFLGRGRDRVGLVELFAGVGGARRAFDLLGLEVAWHVSAELDPRARRVERAAWPDVQQFEDARLITAHSLREAPSKHVHLSVILVTAGPPRRGCHDLSGEPNGKSSDCSQLFAEVPRVKEVVRSLFPRARVHALLETVADISSASLNCISSVMGAIPVGLCMKGWGPALRPRLYWIDWPLHALPGMALRRREQVCEATATGAWPAWADELRNGAARPAGAEALPFFSFVRAASRAKPPLEPAGLGSCDDAARHCWQADSFAYPPYQYAERNLVLEGGRLRPLCASERAVRMGFDWAHLDAAIGKQDKSLPEREKERLKCALVGSAFCAPAVALLVGQLFAACDVLPRPPTPERAWGEPDAEELELAARVFRRDPAQMSETEWQWQALRQMVRSARYTGSDVRLTTQAALRPNLWPRQSLAARCWNWRAILSFPIREQHVNLLEVKAIVASFNARFRRLEELSRRLVHVSDSQVSISVLVKGRTSAATLGAAVTRFNALSLAAFSHPYFVYVSSGENPADEPSRWYDALES